MNPDSQQEKKRKQRTTREIQRILEQRAKEVSQSESDAADEFDQLEVIEFMLGYEKYAIESAYVREVYPMSDFTFLPCAPDFLFGIMNLRGTILSLIDIRKFFHLPVQGMSNLNRVLVIETEEMTVGILADFIRGVRRISRQEIKPPMTTMGGIRSEYLKGLTREPVVIIDIEKVMKDPKLIINEEVEM